MMINRIAHLTTGVIAALASTLENGWMLTLVTAGGFFLYELNEEHNIQRSGDPAYQEIGEFMMGFCTGIAIMLIKKFILVI